MLRHVKEIEVALQAWREAGTIRWFRLSASSVLTAMNHGLIEARHEMVLIVFPVGRALLICTYCSYYLVAHLTENDYSDKLLAEVVRESTAPG